MKIHRDVKVHGLNSVVIIIASVGLRKIVMVFLVDSTFIIPALVFIAVFSNLIGEKYIFKEVEDGKEQARI